MHGAGSCGQGRHLGARPQREAGLVGCCVEWTRRVYSARLEHQVLPDRRPLWRGCHLGASLPRGHHADQMRGLPVCSC